MNTSTLRILLLAVVLAFAACSDPRRTSLSRLRHADATDLRMAVAQLHTRLYPAPGPTFVAVGPELWPPVLMKLRPLRMNLFPDGLAITLQAEPGMEYGLQILATGDSREPLSNERTHYEKIQDGIYYFAQQR